MRRRGIRGRRGGVGGAVRGRRAGGGRIAGATRARSSIPSTRQLVPLHEETLGIYRELEGFPLAARAGGRSRCSRTSAPRWQAPAASCSTPDAAAAVGADAGRGTDRVSAGHRVSGAARRGHDRAGRAGPLAGRGAARGLPGRAGCEGRPGARDPARGSHARGGRRARGRRPLDAVARRSDWRLAPDHAGLGRRGRGRPRGAPAPRPRGGRSRGGRSGRAWTPCSVSCPRTGPAAWVHLLAGRARSRRRWRRGSWRRASGSCPPWRAHRSPEHGCARGPSRWTAARCWARCPGSRISTWRPATGRGAYPWAPRRHASSSTRCSAGPRCPRPLRQSA